MIEWQPSVASGRRVQDMRREQEVLPAAGGDPGHAGLLPAGSAVGAGGRRRRRHGAPARPQPPRWSTLGSKHCFIRNMIVLSLERHDTDAP